LSSSATASSSASVTVVKSVPLRRYWRRSPLVFSLSRAARGRADRRRRRRCRRRCAPASSRASPAPGPRSASGAARRAASAPWRRAPARRARAGSRRATVVLELPGSLLDRDDDRGPLAAEALGVEAINVRGQRRLPGFLSTVVDRSELGWVHLKLARLSVRARVRAGAARAPQPMLGTSAGRRRCALPSRSAAALVLPVRCRRGTDRCARS
jgi:hypothetical protein